MLPRPPQLAKILNHYTLIALCAIGLVYHLLSIQGKFVASTSAIPKTSGASGAPEALHQNKNGIPRLIWYKLGPKGMSNEVRNWTDTCIKGNPGYQAHFLTDESGDDYVRKAFALRPDIVQTYLGFSIPIYKADMLRYLLLWDQGGIWYDLDVSCEGKPIDEWVPVEHQDAALVVGWEFDAGWPEPFGRQFASWTIMSRPRSPHIMQVVDDILDQVRQKTAEYEVPVENLTLEMMGDVVDFTGPRRLTKSVFKSLEKEHHIINTTEVHSIMQPVSIGDVLIMPGRSFAATANRYSPEQETLLPPQLVTHHYAGSWKNDKGGETKRKI